MILKLNGTHQLPVYADHVNLLSDDINNLYKNTGTVIDASEEAGLSLDFHRSLPSSRSIFLFLGAFYVQRG
jgi:hypothetical protein